MPVCARNVVAASQPLAAQAGLDLMRQGGNAVDAALATAICLTVVEPTSNGIGSDAFALVWDGTRLHGFNGSGRSPQAWHPGRFAGRATMPTDGWDAVTVPGAVDAWVRVHARFGAMPFARLFESAIRYAEEGYVVSPITARAWGLSRTRLGARADWTAGFTDAGHTPEPGELWRFPDQAETLRTIAATQGEAFYRGNLAERIVAHSRSEGGVLELQDLAAHEGEWVEPIGLDYAGHRLHEIPPNGQGIAALMALGILEHTPIVEAQADSVGWTHWQVEAMKLALQDAFASVADPSAMRRSVSELLDPERLAARARLIRPDRATPVALRVPPGHGTVYLAAADREGRMVSFIQSNYMGFGSGVVVPGTGISLQNRGAGFVLTPGHPNQVGGGKRPFHTIIPAFATRGSEAAMSFGVMGGHMQAQGHVQMMLRVFGAGQNPQAASDAPRWYVSEDGGILHLERGFDPSVADALRAMGHPVRREEAPGHFGGAQLILRTPTGYIAGSDHRKDGQAVGF
ncbi:MAG: gamma-glutamyltransferase family protein [Fimbriimonadaceae bacterium]|nr:gamma-glutamyltransferase family protein [Fimbriimonadaceae bacterium]